MRICSECKNKMNRGYVIENGLEYYCSDDCLHKHYTEKEYLELYNNGEGDSYYTEWESDEMSNYEILIEKLKENTDVIGEMVSDVYGYNGHLEDFYWCYHDEDFYDIYFRDKQEIARAVYYASNYNYTDDYVRFNVYGNLETCCEYERDCELRDYVEEILDEWYELYLGDDVCDLSNKEIMELIKKGGIKND